MKELQAILRACQAEIESPRGTGGSFALATVVHVEGSAYRRPGARMLICPDGSRVGSVSGGCLEADVAQRAQQVVATGKPEYVLYDTRVSNGDLIMELGCRGAIGVLIEPVVSPDVRSTLRILDGLLRERQPGAMATVYQVEGYAPLVLGNRLLRTAGENIYAGNSADVPLSTLLPNLERVMLQKRTEICTLSFPDGVVQVLLEPILPPVSLLVFGTGQDAMPLLQLAQTLGWQTTVIDHRASMLSTERFPGSLPLLLSHPEAWDELPTFDSRTAAVIMNHSYVQDLACLRHLLTSSLPYIGLLGPRKRADEMLAELQSEGIVLDVDTLSRLYSPIGLDIGSETPDEIALSILAEILATLNQRPAGSLRDRTAPIH